MSFLETWNNKIHINVPYILSKISNQKNIIFQLHDKQQVQKSQQCAFFSFFRSELFTNTIKHWDYIVEHVWNVMAQAQKPDLVFQRNGRVHLNWRRGQFSRIPAAKVCTSAVVTVVILDTPCSEVECKTTGYPLHLHVSPTLPLLCITVCHQVSTEIYCWQLDKWVWSIIGMIETE